MKDKLSPAGIGVITVFTVLIVLCLAVFSALTLSCARADLRLSQLNAEAVTAYYAADKQAQSLYRNFSLSNEPELETQIPISDSQALHLHLTRQPDTTIAILAWNTITLDQEPSSVLLPVWRGA
ncbi:MAG: hypothetical protein RR053_02925 [Evtepia sp.]